MSSRKLGNISTLVVPTTFVVESVGTRGPALCIEWLPSHFGWRAKRLVISVRHLRKAKAHVRALWRTPHLLKRSSRPRRAFVGWTCGTLKRQTPCAKHCLRFTSRCCWKQSTTTSTITDAAQPNCYCGRAARARINRRPGPPQNKTISKYFPIPATATEDDGRTDCFTITGLFVSIALALMKAPCPVLAR